MMCLVEHSNQHRRNAYLGILKPAPVRSRRNRPGCVSALASGKGGIHGGRDWLLRFGQSREKVFTLRRVPLQTLAYPPTA
jgi:hypothetical protein